VNNEPTVTPFQKRVFAIPEQYDVALGGGRGGGKSYALALLGLRHVEQHGPSARALFLRQNYPALPDFESILRELFGFVYGASASYNAAAHLWRFETGATFQLSQLDSEKAYQKIQGQSYTLLLCDEVGQYPNPELLDRVRSNLRGRRGTPVRMVVAANPVGAGHAWIAKRYVFNGAGPWVPFDEPTSGRTWVYCPSTYLDNPEIDREAYARQIKASCGNDDELLKAWLAGDWSVARGAFFASVLEESSVAVDPEPWSPDFFIPKPGPVWTTAHPRSPGRVAPQMLYPGGANWELYLAHDFGVAAPSVTFVCAESPGGRGPDDRFYPRGSIVLVDELATADPSNPNEGLGWTIPRLAEEIRELAGRWGMGYPTGAADDAIFSFHGSGAGSIADEFASCGVYFSPARKGGRRTGWEIMRKMLEAAGSIDRPGLYVSRRCRYFWETVPYLGRDPRRPDDVDSRGADHAADACRYALTRQIYGFKSEHWRV